VFEHNRVPTILATPLTEPGPPTGPPVRRGCHRQPAGSDPPAVFPVRPELARLLPHRGLRRGTAVAVAPGRGGTTLLLALLAEASRAGSWCGVVGWPELGGLAAAELGVALPRVVAVHDPGGQWPAVTAALLDAADLVVLRPPDRVDPRDVRRLSARARERRATLLTAGDWPGAELCLSIVDSIWHGLGRGAGQLRGREVTIRAEGRGAAAHPREGRARLEAVA
jgi:hypothetical protein